MINITENIRKALEVENIGCEIFLELQKPFHVVDQQILLAKLNQYEIGRVSNDWFKSYLCNCNQYVSINVYESVSAASTYGAPQGSVLGPLLFYFK